jgi:hypothetical protein
MHCRKHYVSELNQEDMIALFAAGRDQGPNQKTINKKVIVASASPQTRAEDSIPWCASFWEFCARYCGDRFGGEWRPSPEQ